MKLNISFARKIWILVLLTILVSIVTAMFPPFPQSPAYHNFADKRLLAGIPNCWNVITNIPFLITGGTGLSLLIKFRNKGINTIYTFLFIGVFFTGLGSAYYHLAPGNDTLVFDRIPMTIAFMSLVSAIIAESINPKAGIILLVPLLITGIGSVVLWHITELQGAGDLRLYGLVQFYPMLLVPLILILFPSGQGNAGLRALVLAFTWYAVAKFFEHFDSAIFSVGHFLSGHSLKHLAAAISTWYLVELFREKHLVVQKSA